MRVDGDGAQCGPAAGKLAHLGNALERIGFGYTDEAAPASRERDAERLRRVLASDAFRPTR